jgi:hypothetical protein
MTAYNARFAKHATLGAATVDSVLLSWTGRRIQVANHDAAAIIYVTVGGPTVAGTTDPVSAADDTFVVRPASSTFIPWPTSTVGPVCVKLISAGTPAYSVQVLTDLTVS